MAITASPPPTGQSPALLGWSDVENLVQLLVKQIRSSSWNPNVIIALSRGGFVPATMLAYRLDVERVIGLDVIKGPDGLRSLGPFSRPGRLNDCRVLIVDDGIISGRLLDITPDAVRALGGEPRTCALISEGTGPDPNYLAQTYHRIPRFPWE